MTKLDVDLLNEFLHCPTNITGVIPDESEPKT